MGPLQMATTEELMRELEGRSEHLAVAMIRKARQGERSQFMFRWHGDTTTCIGLAVRLMDELRQWGLETPLEPNDEGAGDPGSG